jgi:outer membrane biogenesis lipoprotein LolB
MRHRSHHHRTVAGTALLLLGTGAVSAEHVPAATKPTAPQWSL